MKLNSYIKEKTFFRIKKRILDPEITESINSLIKISDGLCHIENIEIVFENNIDPRNDATNKVIYLPASYTGNENGIFSVLKKHLGSKYKEAIVLHEFGHAVENNNKNPHNINITSNPSLNYLFNGASVPNKINNFLIEMYKEGYADCYSGLCLYKKYNDINIFNNISSARKQRYKELKNLNGNEFIHPNFNYQAPLEFKKIIESLMLNKIDIFNLPYKNQNESIEKKLEEAVIKGCLQALKKELEINDAFLNHFLMFSKEKEFKIYKEEKVIKEYAQHYNIINIEQAVKFLNEQTVLPYFIEFQKRTNETFLSNKEIEELIENKSLTRKTMSNSILMDVKVIPYSAGIEKSKVSCNIKNIRNKLLIENKDISHIKVTFK